MKKKISDDLIKTLKQNYTIEDASSPFDRVIELIGIDNALRLTEAFSGTTIYFPKINTIFREFIVRQICKEFNGDNYFDLAIKYGICEKTVRNLMDKKKKVTLRH